MKAIWNGAVLAQSDDIVQLEGNFYFPAEALNLAYFSPSGHSSSCPWKGLAKYYSIEVEGKRNDNAAWYYPDPSAAAERIRGRVAFWKGVSVV